MAREIPYFDRLAQAQWFERWGFMGFALVGCLGIVAGKLLLDENDASSALIVTGGAVALMLVYAAIMWRSIAGRIRADQAGDNLYYLGLLYTLSGLAYAIFTFRPETKSNSIVEGFGIALATTIAGLMLRVFFNQVRADLVEIEDRARMDLTDAATALKSELNRIAVEMNDFGRQTRQSLAEAVDGVEAGMLKTIKEAGTRLEKMSATAEGKVLEAFEKLDGCADELVGSTKEASGAIAEHAAATRKSSQALERAAAKTEAFADTADRVDTLASQVLQQATSASAVQNAAADTAERLKQQSLELTKLVAEMTAAIQTSSAAHDSRLKELEALPVASSENIAGLLEQIENRAQSQLTKVAEASSEAVQAHVETLRTAVSTLKQFNADLAAELDKSKDMSVRVQSGFVEAVNTLTQHIDGDEPHQ